MTETEAIAYARKALKREGRLRCILAETGLVRVAIPAPSPVTYANGTAPVRKKAGVVEVTMSRCGSWIFKPCGFEPKEGK